MSGLFTPTATTTTTKCPSGTVVVQITRYADPFNTYTGGVALTCQFVQANSEATTGPLYAAVPVALGHTSAVSATSSCPPGVAAVGLNGRAGEVIDGFRVMCANGSNPTAGAYVGGSGGTDKGTYLCSNYGAQMITRLTVTAAPFYGGYNIISLRGYCADTLAISQGLGSVPPAERIYRTSDSWGPVTFSMLVSTARGGPHVGSHYYAIQNLVVATDCSRATRVRGALVVHRRRAGQRQHFSSRLGGFRIDGRLYGSLDRPQVRATVKVMKGRCRGEVVRFTAAKSRSQG